MTSVEFANLIGASVEQLRTCEDLLSWGARAGALTAEQETALRRRAAAEPNQADRVLQKARRFGAALYRLLRSAVEGEPDRAELEGFNQYAAEALGHGRVAYAHGAFRLGFDAAGRLEGVLAVIAWDAVELLRGSDLDRLRVCASPGCGKLFVDRSKNASRRWCDMSRCGNTEKARRFLARRKGQLPTPRPQRARTPPTPLRVPGVTDPIEED